MRSIQEVGTEILENRPKTFYIFAGQEYGVKMKYVEILAKHFGSKIEAESVESVFNIMRTKHILPLQPAVYVVRYDEAFVSSLSETTKMNISSSKICGCIVCIYDQPKHVSKLNKYLEDYIVSIDSVNSNYLSKYLHSDFPGLNDRFIDIAIKSSSDYNQAKNICRCMMNAPTEQMYALSDSDIANIFGHVNLLSDSAIKQGVASRNFNYLVYVIDNYDDDLNNVLYTILSTMIELDKCMDSTYAQSDLRPHVKSWKREDVYNMFMNTYDMLVKSRTLSISDTKDMLIYLISLLKFNTIPSKEVMI